MCVCRCKTGTICTGVWSIGSALALADSVSCRSPCLRTFVGDECGERGGLRAAVTADWQARKFHLQRFIFNTRHRGCVCFHAAPWLPARADWRDALRLITAADVESVNFSKHSLIHEKLSDCFFFLSFFLASPPVKRTSRFDRLFVYKFTCVSMGASV